jgi:hypothetical protein
VVLALSDKAEESVSLFQSGRIIDFMRVTRSQMALVHFNKLQKMIRDALHHDHSYYTQHNKTFPRELQFLENLEPGSPRPGGLLRPNDRSPASRPDGRPPP